MRAPFDRCWCGFNWSSVRWGFRSWRVKYRARLRPLFDPCGAGALGAGRRVSLTHNLAVTIRPYAAGDETACRACIVQLQEAERQIEPRLRRGDEIADAYLQQMLARCDQYAGAIFVAEVAGAVVGLTMVLVHVPFEELDEPPGDYAIVAE